MEPQPTTEQVMDGTLGPSMELKRWHWWLLYGLAVGTCVLGVFTTLAIVRAGSAVSEVQQLSAENQRALCQIAQLRLENRPETPTERALRRFYQERGSGTGVCPAE